MGALFISGSYDLMLRLWRPRDGLCLQVLRGHSGTVWCVVAVGGWCVSGAADNLLKV